MSEEKQLSKRERRLLVKQEKREARVRAERSKKLRKFLIIVGVVLAMSFGTYRWLKSATGEVVGEEAVDLGRDHTRDISEVVYNSNPPTSGTHFPVWAKGGVYDRVISDGYLVHSLEHGYVVISYDCAADREGEAMNLRWFRDLAIERVLAHEEGDDIPEGELHDEEATGAAEPLTRMEAGEEGMSFFTPDNAPESEIDLGEEFETEECLALKSQLEAFYGKNRNKRLIVVPRVGLDAKMAMTAWTRIVKMEEWDEELAMRFLRQWENRGPEKTVE